MPYWLLSKGLILQKNTVLSITAYGITYIVNHLFEYGPKWTITFNIK